MPLRLLHADGAVLKVRLLPRFGTVVLLFLFSSLAFLLQIRNGAYGYGFGSNPDESAHYVTGLMVYRYVLTGIGTNPMQFAERFYAHYPAVAFGHWPPFFYLLQASWGVLFGLSRQSALVLMAVLAGVLATMVYFVVASRISPLYGALFGLLCTCLPIVQRHTGMIMGEIPLTICTLATVLAWEQLIRWPSTARALWAGLWLSCAILVKGNGWALIGIPACGVLLSTKRVQFLLRYVSVALLPVVLFCFPVTLLTMKMTKDGWDQSSPSLAFAARALPLFFAEHLQIIGVPLAVLALLGTVAKVISPFLDGRRYDVFWCCCLAAVCSVLLFHSVVPTSVEARKMFMSIPFLLFFAAAGLEAIARALTRWRMPYQYAAVLGFLICAYLLMKPYATAHTNMGVAAESFLSRDPSRKSAVFVASTSLDEREELSFVAEIASREQGNLNHAVIRAGKLLADSSWSGSGYKVLYPEASIDGLLRSVPVSAVVLFVGDGAKNGHGMLVAKSLAEHSQEWDTVEDHNTGSGTLRLVWSRAPASQAFRLPPINLDRKLGREIKASF